MDEETAQPEEIKIPNMEGLKPTKAQLAAQTEARAKWLKWRDEVHKPALAKILGELS